VEAVLLEMASNNLNASSSSIREYSGANARQSSRDREVSVSGAGMDEEEGGGGRCSPTNRRLQDPVSVPTTTTTITTTSAVGDIPDDTATTPGPAPVIQSFTTTITNFFETLQIPLSTSSSSSPPPPKEINNKGASGRWRILMAVNKASSKDLRRSPRNDGSKKDNALTSTTTLVSPVNSSTMTCQRWLAKKYYNEAVQTALAQGIAILGQVQHEVLLLLEKDTLPRFKTSRWFVQYVEAEPLLFQGGGA